MRSKWDNLFAGIGAVYILLTVTSVIMSHGKDPKGAIDWGDIAWFLFSMAVFASAVIDIHKFFKDE